jgi:glc operon protein GlcG
MKTISLENALAHVNKAIAIAKSKRVRIAVAVVDRGGHVIASARMDEVAYINIEVARRKANAAQLMSAPTHAVLEGVGDDGNILRAFDAMSTDMIVLPGGAPITEIVTVVGGLGVAGAHYNMDKEIVQATIAELVAYS